MTLMIHSMVQQLAVNKVLQVHPGLQNNQYPCGKEKKKSTRMLLNVLGDLIDEFLQSGVSAPKRFYLRK